MKKQYSGLICQAIFIEAQVPLLVASGKPDGYIEYIGADVESFQNYSPFITTPITSDDSPLEF